MNMEAEFVLLALTEANFMIYPFSSCANWLYNCFSMRATFYFSTRVKSIWSISVRSMQMLMRS